MESIPGWAKAGLEMSGVEEQAVSALFQIVKKIYCLELQVLVWDPVHPQDQVREADRV